jgi:hypothetical protein
VNVVFAGQLCTKSPLVNGIEIELIALGHVGAVKPGVRPIPGLGSFSQARAMRFTAYRTCADTPIPGAAVASVKDNWVSISVEVAVGWFIVIPVIVPGPVTKAVPTLAEVTG